MGFGAKVLTGEEGVKNADSIEVKPVLICAEVPEKFGECFGGGKGPQLFFPSRHLSLNFFVSGEGVLKAWPNVASVDAGDDRSVRLLRQFPESSGKKRFRGSFGRRSSRFHGVLESAAENGKDGEGATWKKEIAKGLQPDHNKFDRVFSLKAPRF
jgi:hypothetical protein